MIETKPHVKITGLLQVREPRPNKGGSMVIAWFDCDVGVFSLRGCALVRTARLGIGVWMPKLDDPSASVKRSLTLHCEPTRNAILKAARATYIALGGVHAEWISRDVNGDPEMVDGKVVVPVRNLAAPQSFASGIMHPPPAREQPELLEADEAEGVARFLGVKE